MNYVFPFVRSCVSFASAWTYSPVIKFAVSSPHCLVGHVHEKVSDDEMNVLKVNNFIDHITTKSDRAARIESHGAYYIQATHLQTNSKLFKYT